MTALEAPATPRYEVRRLPTHRLGVRYEVRDYVGLLMSRSPGDRGVLEVYAQALARHNGWHLAGWETIRAEATPGGTLYTIAVAGWEDIAGALYPARMWPVPPSIAVIIPPPPEPAMPWRRPSPPPPLGCAAVTALLAERGIEHDGCCNSCHEDWDEGYDSPLEDRLGDGRAVRVCCSLHHALEDAGLLAKEED